MNADHAAAEEVADSKSVNLTSCGAGTDTAPFHWPAVSPSRNRRRFFDIWILVLPAVQKVSLFRSGTVVVNLPVTFAK